MINGYKQVWSCEIHMDRIGFRRGNDIDGEAAEDYSGNTVSLSSDGTIVAIGAYGNDGKGANYWSCQGYTNGTVRLGFKKVLT